MRIVPMGPLQIETHLSEQAATNHIKEYEDFLQQVIEGQHGPTAQYWAIYIYLINRLHRDLQRCVKTNDVTQYMVVFPALLEVSFALICPNYARWGTLFLQKLQNSAPQIRKMLEMGEFSIRQTRKDYSRSAIDLSLEQTVNRNAASQMKGLVAFRSSENAI